MNLAGEIEWVMTDHICRVCFGRVLVRRKPRSADLVFRCSCCGAQEVGTEASAICCCGLKLAGDRDMGIRCQANTERTTESNTEIVAKVMEPGP